MILGGTITVIGTSTNVLASDLSKQLGYREFNLFQFTALGLITFSIGLTYLALLGPQLLPERIDGDVGQAYRFKDYVSEVVVTSRSSLVGQTVRSSALQRKFDVDVLELIHNYSHFPQPLVDKVLTDGDVLLVRGGREELLKIKDEKGIDILSDFQFGPESLETDLSSGEEGIAEVLILSNSNLIGSTLKDLRFRQRHNATVLALRRGQELVRDRLGKVPLRFGDLLLVQGPK